MGSHGKRIKIKTYQDNLTDVILTRSFSQRLNLYNLTDVILTRSFSQRFNLLGYIDTVLWIAGT